MRHLFHGPPATGKTQAMKVIAAEAGLSGRFLKVFGLGFRGLGVRVRVRVRGFKF